MEQLFQKLRMLLHIEEVETDNPGGDNRCRCQNPYPPQAGILCLFAGSAARVPVVVVPAEPANESVVPVSEPVVSVAADPLVPDSEALEPVTPPVFAVVTLFRRSRLGRRSNHRFHGIVVGLGSFPANPNSSKYRVAHSDGIVAHAELDNLYLAAVKHAVALSSVLHSVCSKVEIGSLIHP